jgi:outer membrane protein assembly factor BamB
MYGELIGGWIMRRAFLLTVGVFIVVGLVGRVPAFAVDARGDWWTFMHDRQHTGRSPYTGPSTATKKWEFATGAGLYSSAAIRSDGTIYVGSMDHKLYALNPNGSKKWEFPALDIIASSPAIAPDGTIYVGSYDGRAYAINPDGSEQWEFPTAGSVYCSPAIGADGTVYIGSFDDKVYALDPDGSKKWEFVTGGDVWSSPAIGPDGTIYVGSSDAKLHAINPNGSKKWEFPTAGGVSSSPAIGADGTIYVGSYDHRLYAINPSGTKKWEFLTGDIVLSSPAIGPDGRIYIGSYDKKVYAINPDGSKEWEFATPAAVYASPAIGADGTIYIGSLDAKLYAIGSNGSKKWEFVTGGNVYPAPAIGSDGTVYCGSMDGKFYAIGPGPSAPYNSSLSPNVGPLPVGVKTTFTTSYGDSNGYSDIARCYLLINTSLAYTNAIYAMYDRASNKLYVRNDTNTGWLGGFAPGSANTISNSQCTLYCADSTTSGSGYFRTVKWVIVAKQVMAGKTVNGYLCVSDLGGLTDSWDQGAWNCKFSNPPANVSISPGTGPVVLNTKLTFTSKYSDPNGYADIGRCYFLLNTSQSYTNAVYAMYDTVANKLYLRDDANAGWMGGYAPGSANTIANSQCILYCGETSIPGSGNIRTVNWRLLIKPSMTGKVCDAWLLTTDKTGLSDGWDKLGSDYSLTSGPTNVGMTQTPDAFAVNQLRWFRTEYSDPDGFADIARCYFLINTSLSYANAVYVMYDTTTNKLYLRNDANTGWLGGFALGSANTIGNSQCILYCANTGTSGAGSLRKVDWGVELRPTMAGKVVDAWMYVSDKSGLTDGPDQVRSDYKVTHAPADVSLAPSTGALAVNTKLTFAAKYSDADGYADISSCYLLINTSASYTNSIDVLYHVGSNQIYLLNDDNTAWLGPCTLGSANTLSNSQCIVYCADTTTAGTGNVRTVNFRIQLKPSVSGKTCGGWLSVVDKAGFSDSDQSGSNFVVN